MPLGSPLRDVPSPPTFLFPLMGSAYSTLHPSSVFGRTPLRVLITVVLVSSFGLLLVNSSLLSLPLSLAPGSSSSSPGSPSSSSPHATWPESNAQTTHPRPPDAPRDDRGRCVFQDPLKHLAFAVTSSSPAEEHELGEASPLDRRRTDEAGVLSVGREDETVGQHPMLGLIRQGEREFTTKVGRQSRTVAEARAEYERRNDGRSPPIGFDDWSAQSGGSTTALVRPGQLNECFLGLQVPIRSGEGRS